MMNCIGVVILLATTTIVDAFVPTGCQNRIVSTHVPSTRRHHNANGHIRIRPSISKHFADANKEQDDGDAGENKNKLLGIVVRAIKWLKIRSRLTRLVNNFWYVLTVPFPELRTIVRLAARERAKDNATQEMSISLGFREGILGLFAYLAVGVLCYHKLFEQYSFVDALYYTCVCFSTVGYGDLCPVTPGGKLFTCLFSITGIALLGACVASIGSSLIQVEKEAINVAKKVSRKRLIHLYDKMPKVIKQIRLTHDKKLRSQILSDATSSDKDPSSKKLRIFGGFMKTFRWLIQSMFFVSMGGLLVGFFEDWHWTNSIYYSFITASTIGLGDFAPKTRNGRLCAVIFIPMAVAAIGEILAAVGLAQIARRQKTMFKNQLNLGLSTDHLEAMDSNGDGTVDREEYVLFMLLEMGLVSQSEIEELFDQFERLDVTDSGYLDQADLVLMAKLREEQAEAKLQEEQAEAMLLEEQDEARLREELDEGRSRDEQAEDTLREEEDEENLTKPEN